MSNTYVVKVNDYQSTWDEEIEAESYAVSDGLVSFYRKRDDGSFEAVFTVRDSHFLSVKKV